MKTNGLNGALKNKLFQNSAPFLRKIFSSIVIVRFMMNKTLTCRVWFGHLYVCWDWPYNLTTMRPPYIYGHIEYNKILTSGGVQTHGSKQ